MLPYIIPAKHIAHCAPMTTKRYTSRLQTRGLQVPEEPPAPMTALGESLLTPYPPTTRTPNTPWGATFVEVGSAKWAEQRHWRA